MKALKLFFFVAVVIVGAESAFASGLVVPGGPTVLDGSTSIPADSSSPPSLATSEISFSSVLEPGRSYACTVIPDSTFLDDLRFIGVSDPSTNAVTATSIGAVTPATRGGSNVAATRISITPSGSGTQVAGAYIMSIANQTANLSNTSQATEGRVDCVETTLYGGYNTNVNDFNFLELVNITNTTLSGTITATNFDGTVVVNAQAFSVAANRRLDIDIHTAAGPAKYGLIQVTHNGPYGGLQGTVSQYDGTINNFVLTASIPLRPRER